MTVHEERRMTHVPRQINPLQIALVIAEAHVHRVHGGDVKHLD